MRKLAGACFGLCLLTALSVHAAPAPDLEDPAAVAAFVDGLVPTLMRANHSPSGTVAIAHRGRTILTRGYGFADIEAGEPVDPTHTLFRPGSVSKLFTWVAVMQLVEQGRLDLDTDVNDYLEGFRIADTFDAPVTLRHAMTHTAGFEDGAVGYLIQNDIDAALPLAEAMRVYQPARVNPPGAQTAYSNYATALAGLIVETVSGEPYAEYVRRNILGPLGMDRTTFAEPLPPALADAMAKSYGYDAGRYVEKPFEIISSFAPAGAASTTGADMLRFGNALLAGGALGDARILAPETVDLMLTRAFSHDDRLMGMALGFYESDVNGVRLVGHGGDTQWFHTEFAIDAEHELVLFVSFGASGGGEVRSLFMKSFYDAFFPTEVAPPESPPDFDARAARFAGEFGFWRTNFSNFEKILGLGGAVSIAPTGDGALLLAFGGGSKRYVEVDAGLFREAVPGAPLVAGLAPEFLAFQEDEAGRVTGFVMSDLPFMSLRRLPLADSPNFNLSALGLSLLVFLAALASHWMRRPERVTLDASSRSAARTAALTAGTHLFVLASGAVVVAAYGETFFSRIPTAFAVWLALPLVAVAVSALLVARTVQVWRTPLLGGLAARARLTCVTACALFMVWFYAHWNLLGWQYPG